MKQILFKVLGLLLLVVAVGCGKQPGIKVVLGDGSIIEPEFVTNGEFQAWDFSETSVPGFPNAARLADRENKKLLTFKTVKEVEYGLRYVFTSYQTKIGADMYSRILLSLTNVSDAPIAIDRLIAFDSMEVNGGQWRISGNTDGAVGIGSDDNATSFFALEHPMAKLSLSPTSGGPTWTPEDIRRGTWEFPVTDGEGDLTLTFEYRKGRHRTDIAKVEVVGTEIADVHRGFAGVPSSANVYVLKRLPAGRKTIRVTFAYEGENRDVESEGVVVLGGAAVSNGKMLASAWIPVADVIRPGETWTYSAVFGQVSESSQLRRVFQTYLDRERAHPYRVFPHYNSWYDLCINRNDSPWQRRMHEAECMETMKAFRRELGSRGVHIDSYLWDDGWDNWDSLWGFHPGFPNGFAALAEEAHRDGASVSAWMSPCGGYGGSQAARIRYAKREGILAPNEGLMRLSSPKYYVAFRDRCLDMIRKYDMNMFKFDRMGSGHDAVGAEPHHAADLRAVFRLIDEMRMAKPDVFINATVGTWASPFWVMWADSIWRGGNDWEGLGPGPQRERWITYRDNKIHDRFAAPCPLFPLNSMMMHGIIVGEKGPPACMDRSDSPASSRAFANEVWMGMACGTGLQEYYITPKLMHKAWWDILAEAIKWLRANESTLRDVHWVGGDPQDGKNWNVYGYASLGIDKGIVALRNPSDRLQSFTMNPDVLLEMPNSLRGRKVKAQRTVYASDDGVGIVPNFLTTAETRQLELGPFGVIVLEFDF